MDESVELPGQLQFFWDEAPQEPEDQSSGRSKSKKSQKNSKAVNRKKSGTSQSVRKSQTKSAAARRNASATKTPADTKPSDTKPAKTGDAASGSEAGRPARKKTRKKRQKPSLTAPSAPQPRQPVADAEAKKSKKTKKQPAVLGTAKKSVASRKGAHRPQPTAKTQSPAASNSDATADLKSSPQTTSKPQSQAKKKATQVAKKASTKKKTTRKAPSAKSATASRKAASKKAAGKKSAAKPKKVTPRKATETVAPAVDVDHSEKVECFDMKWGAQFPKVGLGFWKVEEEKTADVCTEAIRIGYRHLDCACDYGNEVQVGKGIANAVKKGYCDREDLWVTSKLWNTYHAPSHVQMACEKSLEDLGLDYLDLYLIHFPIAQRFVPFEKRYPPGWFFEPKASEPVIEEARVPLMETWQAMEELAKSGMVRNIGICNVGTSQLRDLLSYAKIRPSVLQVESHPYLTQEKLLRYCQDQGITYTAFSPLGAQSYFSLDMAKPSESALENKTIKAIAAEVSRTPAQVLLRWGVQRGTSVIPKTSDPARLVENIDVFDFQLTQKQMKAITALDQGRRFNDPGDFGEAAFNTFLPIYE